MKFPVLLFPECISLEDMDILKKEWEIIGLCPWETADYWIVFSGFQGGWPVAVYSKWNGSLVTPVTASRRSTLHVCLACTRYRIEWATEKLGGNVSWWEQHCPPSCGWYNGRFSKQDI